MSERLRLTLCVVALGAVVACDGSDDASSSGATADASGATADDGGVRSFVTQYSTTPLCEGEPADACQKCGCTECAAEMTACNKLEGNAKAGPGAGAPKAEICRALVNCGRINNCRGATCLQTCMNEILAAAEGELTDAIVRMADLSYAVGTGNAVSNCTALSCAAACTR